MEINPVEHRKAGYAKMYYHLEKSDTTANHIAHGILLSEKQEADWPLRVTPQSNVLRVELEGVRNSWCVCVWCGARGEYPLY